MSSMNCLVILCAIISYTLAFFATPKNHTGLFKLQNWETRFNRADEFVTPLEALRGPIRFLRQLTYAKFNPEKSFLHNVRLGKIQRQIPADTPFPCDLSFARSQTPPSSVHKLRPGDIDIIAAIGDSMSAGTCLMTESFLQIPYENRGITFSGGGYGNWRQFLTLPNILKEFNPKLYGYAIADGFTFQSSSRFNVAEPAGMSRDLVYQAKLLIQRMRKDPNVDLQRHWKLVTIFIGSVDFCEDFCLFEDVSIPLRYHERDLRQSLTLLRDNIPRLFVNLLPAPNSIRTFQNMKVPPHCYAIHRIFCFCVIRANQTDSYYKEYENKIRLWHNVDKYVANLDEFNTEDFTVVYHPFFADPKTPFLPNGDVDRRYFAADCFHFSQLGQASLANSLWNSMVQPFEYKQRNFIKAFDHFECPSLEHPYLATKKNSLDFRV